MGMEVGIRLEEQAKDEERVGLGGRRRRVIGTVGEKTSWVSTPLEESRVLNSRAENNEWYK